MIPPSSAWVLLLVMFTAKESAETEPASSSVAAGATVTVTPLLTFAEPLVAANLKTPPLTRTLVLAGSVGGLVTASVPEPSIAMVGLAAPVTVSGPPSVKVLPAATVNVVPPASAKVNGA